MIFKHGLNGLNSFVGRIAIPLFMYFWVVSLAIPNNITLSIFLLLVGRIAVDGSDYEGRSNVLLTFNADTTSIVVPVNLTDDSVYEGEEDFSGTLNLVSDSPRVTVAPRNAVATILDDEGM